MLQLFEGQLEKIRLQKLLFLFTRKQQRAEYDFVPYRFGCYSFSANADLTTMVTKGLLIEDEKNFTKKNKTDYFKQISPEDKKLLLQVKSDYGKMSSTTLMKHTYLNFPFYAINSVKAESILSSDDYKKVCSARPKGKDTVLFTIGYEGISLEEYFVRLIKNDIKVLIDVRRNPLSMKYGFSKNQLASKCQLLNILYVHIPEVGIPGEQRTELNTQSDYDKLFLIYQKSNLAKTKDSQSKIFDLLNTHKRIALTCFESEICHCHRKPLSEAIKKLAIFDLDVRHI